MLRGLRPHKALACLLPFSFLRKMAYQLLCGYRFGAGSRIGFLTYIDAEKVEIGPGVRIANKCRFKAIVTLHVGPSCRIERECTFYHLGEVRIGENTQVQAFSEFIGAPWDRAGYRATFNVGRDSLICGRMHFDLSRDIMIGERVTVAGLRSSFWTHGLSWDNCKPIRVGDRCFIGSTVMLGPGTDIADDCVVGMGSVVQGKFTEPDCLILGNRAQIVKRHYRATRKGLTEDNRTTSSA